VANKDWPELIAQPELNEHLRQQAEEAMRLPDGHPLKEAIRQQLEAFEQASRNNLLKFLNKLH